MLFSMKVLGAALQAELEWTLSLGAYLWVLGHSVEGDSLEKALRGERGGRMSKWLSNRELVWRAMGLWFNPQHPATQTGNIYTYSSKY